MELTVCGTRCEYFRRLKHISPEAIYSTYGDGAKPATGGLKPATGGRGPQAGKILWWGTHIFGGGGGGPATYEFGPAQAASPTKCKCSSKQGHAPLKETHAREGTPLVYSEAREGTAQAMRDTAEHSLSVSVAPLSGLASLHRGQLGSSKHSKYKSKTIK